MYLGDFPVTFTGTREAIFVRIEVDPPPVVLRPGSSAIDSTFAPDAAHALVDKCETATVIAPNAGLLLHTAIWSEFVSHRVSLALSRIILSPGIARAVMPYMCSEG
jgi:hypothetical protein